MTDHAERLAAAARTARGHHTSTVEAIENGTANPYLTEIVAVARALDTTPSALLT